MLEGAAGRNASPGAAAGGGGGGWRWEDHRDVSVPFLVVISALTALGIGGNILVLGSLIIHKVSQANVLHIMENSGFWSMKDLMPSEDHPRKKILLVKTTDDLPTKVTQGI